MCMCIYLYIYIYICVCVCLQWIKYNYICIYTTVYIYTHSSIYIYIYGILCHQQNPQIFPAHWGGSGLCSPQSPVVRCRADAAALGAFRATASAVVGTGGTRGWKIYNLIYEFLWYLIDINEPKSCFFLLMCGNFKILNISIGFM